jgi:hypothetical protein
METMCLEHAWVVAAFLRGVGVVHCYNWPTSRHGYHQKQGDA